MAFWLLDLDFISVLKSVEDSKAVLFGLVFWFSQAMPSGVIIEFKICLGIGILEEILAGYDYLFCCKFTFSVPHFSLNTVISYVLWNGVNR